MCEQDIPETGLGVIYIIANNSISIEAWIRRIINGHARDFMWQNEETTAHLVFVFAEMKDETLLINNQLCEAGKGTGTQRWYWNKLIV